MNRRGMTLVEIMVVVAIIVSISAVLAVNIKGIWDRAKVSETRIRMGQVEQGLAAFAATHRGRFPTTSEGLDAAWDYLPGGDETALEDAWGQRLSYRSPAGEASYRLGSPGLDGQEGTEDDIVAEGR
jgi:general secretion pathway protein G